MKAQLIDGKIRVNGKLAIIPISAETWLRLQPEGTEAFVQSSNIIYGELVQNGNCYNNTGFRRVVLTKLGELRPILRTINYGYKSERCTMQQYCRFEGDYILEVKWGHGEIGDTIEISNETEEFNGSLTFEISENILDFLRPTSSRTESYLNIYINSKEQLV